MKAEQIRNIVSIYMAFHKAIPGAARLHFRDMRKMLSPVLREEELELVVSDFFSDENRKIIRSEHIFSLASSVRLTGASRQLSRTLSRKEKTLCLAVLLRLLRDNKRQDDKELLGNISIIAEIFGTDKQSLAALRSIFFNEMPAPENYRNSILITGSRPDYTLAVDGLRYYWNEKIKIKAWVLHLPEAESIFIRVTGYENKAEVFDLQAGDVLPFHHHIKAFLELNKVNTEALLAELNKPEVSLPHISITPTEMTPHVTLDPDLRRIEFSGNCLAVAAQHFFSPVFRWIERLSQLSPPEVSIHVNLHYFNTYSSKILLDIFLKLKRLSQQGTNVSYYWYYQQHDEELKESGEYYEEILKVNFNFIEKKSPELNVAAYE